MPDKIKLSDLIQYCRWNTGDAPSGIDYYDLHTHSTRKDVLFLNIYGSVSGWEYDRWYCVLATDFPTALLESFAQRPWTEAKQEILNAIRKELISDPE
jgi:hypothetical protein